MAYSFLLTVDDDNESFALGTYHDLDSHFKRGTINEVTELANKLEETVSGHIEEVSFEKCEKLAPNPCEECDGAGDCGDCTNNEDDWEIEDVDPEGFLSDDDDDDDDDDGYEVGEIIIPIEIPVPSPFDLFLIGAGLLLGFLICRRK